MRILLDKNVPVGVRGFLSGHDVFTIAEMCWPEQIENGALLNQAEELGFAVIVTADQNIRYQQKLSGRSIALVVLGSNIWPIVRSHAAVIAEYVGKVEPGTMVFVEMRHRITR